MESDELDRLEDGIAALERSMGGAGAVTAALDGEMRRVQESLAAAGREAGVLSGGISRGLRRAFDGLVFDGVKLSDALRGVARSMADAAYSAAIRPITKQVGGLIAGGIEGLVAGRFGDGAGFAQGRVMPFASGGVVSGPVTFPMRGGLGLMGEAGPEAIMPLARGADGKLGVRASQSRPVTVVMNVTTPDVAGFRRSESQIAARLSRALARGDRNG